MSYLELLTWVEASIGILMLIGLYYMLARGIIKSDQDDSSQ